MNLKCPRCNQSIGYVKVYTLEQNVQLAFFEQEDFTENGTTGTRPALDYESKDPVGDSAEWTEIECPICASVIVRMKGDGDDKQIIKALTGEENDDKES